MPLDHPPDYLPCPSSLISNTCLVGGELLVHLRATLLRGRVLGGGQELVPSGRGDNKLSLAGEPHKGQVRDSGGQQSGFGEGTRNYHSG